MQDHKYPEIMDSLLENLLTGVMYCDDKAIIQYMNPAFALHSKLNRHDVIGKYVTDVIPHSLVPARLADGKTDIADWSIVEENGSLSKRFHIVHRVPLRDDAGRITGIISQLLVSGPAGLKSLGAGMARLKSRLDSYEEKIRCVLAPRYALCDIVGESHALCRTREQLVRYACTESSVLVTGPTGTGKELFANAVHAESPRADGPFVSINCGAIPRELFEAELFGYEAGAFTGARNSGKLGQIELAHQGTLFLDEIGDMPVTVQSKLLRVLEEKQLFRVGSTKPRSVDFRLVSATNRDLKTMMRESQFREDLYYRISTMVLEVPSLAERKVDIMLLAAHIARKTSGVEIHFTSRAVEALEAYPWPGNVRELRNVVSRAVQLCEKDCVDSPDLTSDIITHMGGSPLPQNGQGRLAAAVHSSEAGLVLEALRATGWNISRAARELGVPRTTLHGKMSRYGICRTSRSI